MVLHHVAQGASAVVKVAPGAHAQAFRQRDLDVGDALAAPQGLEQHVAEAQGHQVLHRGFAEVVVDAQGLAFAEHRTHGPVDGLGRGQVVPQGLFEHHAHCGMVEPGGTQLLTDDGEEMGAGGQVHHHGVGLARLQPLAQHGIVPGLGQVHAQVVHQGGKALELVLCGALGEVIARGQLVLEPLSVAGVGALVAGHCKDATLRGQLAVAPGLEQCRHELAPGEITGAAKKNQIKGHGGDPIRVEYGPQRGRRGRLS